MKKHIPFDGPFPLSNAVVHNHAYTMEVSGQIGMNFETKALVEGIESQTKQAMANISNITKTRIYLSTMADYPQMNKVYETFFSKDFPARVAFAVTELPAGALIEIECTASGDDINR